MGPLARLLYRGRLLFLFLFTGLALFGLWSLPHVRMSFSIDPLIQGDTEERDRAERLEGEMPQSPADIVLILTWPQEIGAPELALTRELAAALRATERVAAVRSLPQVPVVTAAGLLPQLAPFEQTLLTNESARRAAERHPLLIRRMISGDGRSAALLVTGQPDGSESSFDLLLDLETRLPGLVPDEARWRLLGPDLARRAMRDTMVADLARSLLLGLAVFAIVLPLIFRSWRGVVVPLVAIILTILGAIGIFVAAGATLGLIDVAVPAIMVAIGLCDAIHLVHAFEIARRNGDGRQRAIIRSLRSVGVACLFTSVTTAIGFLSLLVADHPAVRIFGIKAALAVFWTFLAVVTLVPALLAFWPAGPARVARVPGLAKRLGGLPGLRHALLGSFILLVFIISGSSRLRIDARWMEELPRDSEVVRDLTWFEKNFGGLLTLDVRVDGDLMDPAFAARIATLQTELLKEEGVNRAESYLDWTREVTRKEENLTRADFERARRGFLAVPAWAPTHVLRPDGRAGRLIFHTSDQGTGHFLALRRRVDEITADWPEGQRADVAGYMLMAHRSSHLVVTTMLQSFGLSLFIICALVGVAFRSWRVGLVVIVPNVLPVAVALGLQGWLNLPLRIGIVMIYALGLGLAVDDSIHFVARFREERRRGAAAELAARRTLSHTGGALLVTSAVLLVSALTYLPSGFASLRDVGILLATVVVVALWADLVLLPRLLIAAARDSSPS